MMCLNSEDVRIDRDDFMKLKADFVEKYPRGVHMSQLEELCNFVGIPIFGTNEFRDLIKSPLISKKIPSCSFLVIHQDFMNQTGHVYVVPSPKQQHNQLSLSILRKWIQFREYGVEGLDVVMEPNNEETMARKHKNKLVKKIIKGTLVHDSIWYHLRKGTFPDLPESSDEREQEFAYAYLGKRKFYPTLKFTGKVTSLDTFKILTALCKKKYPQLWKKTKKEVCDHTSYEFTEAAPD
jgi:hypothetical protein